MGWLLKGNCLVSRTSRRGEGKGEGDEWIWLKYIMHVCVYRYITIKLYSFIYIAMYTYIKLFIENVYIYVYMCVYIYKKIMYNKMA
jgi:hypothetical protein